MLTKPFIRIFRPNVQTNNMSSAIMYSADIVPTHRSLVQCYNLLQTDMKKIFEYVEPAIQNFQSYSYRIYEILLRACTEVESNFKGILKDNIYTKVQSKMNMKDYMKVNKAMKLDKYIIKLAAYNTPPFSPFHSFAEHKSPDWYKHYNDVKHNRHGKFISASLENMIQAVGGLYVLLYAQFNICAHYEDHKHGVYATHDKGISDFNINKVAFDIEQLPTWDVEEKYNFDWDIIKDDPVNFEKYNFDK